MSFIHKYRGLLLLAAVVVLGLLWYAFRPEKLFITQRVNEPAPFVSAGEPAILFTTKLRDGLHPTSGRASVYKQPDGSLQVRLTNFATTNGPDVHVILTNSSDTALTATTPGRSPRLSIELGPLKGNEGDQNYLIPAGTDLAKNNAVVIYCERFHAVFGYGTLQAF